jgi:hypothetical protein
MPKVNLSGMNVEALMDLRMRVDEMLVEHRAKLIEQLERIAVVGGMACTRFRRHRVRCFDGAGGGSWRDGSLRESSSLRPCA